MSFYLELRKINEKENITDSRFETDKYTGDYEFWFCLNDKIYFEDSYDGGKRPDKFSREKIRSIPNSDIFTEVLDLMEKEKDLYMYYY